MTISRGRSQEVSNAPRAIAALCVKNGIGFGHLQRARLIGQALRADGDLSPLIISQARSVEMLRGSGLRGINLPRLPRVSSATTEDIYWEIIDQALTRLQPRVVVEDTFPDSRLGELGSIAGTPRVLVSRRVDPVTFERMLAEGAFARFDVVVICQDRADFEAERHSKWVRRVVCESRLFEFVGPVWRQTTSAEREAARHRVVGPGQRLCLITGGAGGDKYPDAFSARLAVAAQAAAKVLERDEADWTVLMVTGPYAPELHPTGSSKLEVRRWEPELPALLAAADLVILKPGANSLAEALSGEAPIVAVPDRSYGEGLWEYVKLLENRGWVRVASPDPASVAAAVREALTADGPPRDRSGASAAQQVARLISEVAGRAHRLPDRVCHLALRTSDGKGPAQLRHAVDFAVDGQAGRRPSATQPDVLVFEDYPPSDLQPDLLVAQGVRLFVATSTELFSALSRWLHLRGVPPDLYLASASPFRLSAVTVDRFVRCALEHFERKTIPAAFLLVHDDVAEHAVSVVEQHVAALQRAGVTPQPMSEIASVLARAAVRSGP